MSYRLSLRALVVIGLLAGAVAIGLVRLVADDRGHPSPMRASAADLRELRAFAGYPVYWLGTRYAGLDVTGVRRFEGKSAQYAVLYGDAHEVKSEETTESPLTVITYPAKTAPAFDSPGEVRCSVRGVPGVGCRGAEELAVHTGDVVVVLTSSSLNLERAALALRSADGAINVRDRLPQPRRSISSH